jgi:hypothetical protein
MKEFAIIGSGPSGCYLADQLLRTVPDSTVDVLERLPVPFGLVRYGVAPDHQGTKAVSRVLDRILSNPRCAFFGNVEVGRDVSLDQLLATYDVVVLATGCPQDRKLGIPGEDLGGVCGSASFVTWYNTHPDALAPTLNNLRSAVIIGNGNVAIDVARILARDPAEFNGSDLPPEVGDWLQTQPLKEIHIVGRRTAIDAKFTEHELAELGMLLRAQPRIDPEEDLMGDTPVLRVLRDFRAGSTRSTPIIIHFHFSSVPLAFLGDDRLQVVCFRRAGSNFEIAAQLAVTCIGYQANSCCSASPVNGVFENEQGKIKPGLYVVGWAKRGPSGTIPINRSEAQELARLIAKDVTESGRGGRAALIAHLRADEKPFIDYLGWKRIDAAETAGANGVRCRLKMKSVEDMLAVATKTAATNS